jgi:hypothetical protein
MEVLDLNSAIELLLPVKGLKYKLHTTLFFGDNSEKELPKDAGIYHAKRGRAIVMGYLRGTGPISIAYLYESNSIRRLRKALSLDYGYVSNQDKWIPHVSVKYFTRHIDRWENMYEANKAFREGMYIKLPDLLSFRGFENYIVRGKENA